MSGEKETKLGPVLLEGPHKPFMPADAFARSHVGSLKSSIDIPIIIALSIVTYLFSFKRQYLPISLAQFGNSIVPEVKTVEQIELEQALEAYVSNTFYLGPVTPLAVRLVSHCYCKVTFALGSMIFLYLTMRRVSNNWKFIFPSLLTISIITISDPFQKVISSNGNPVDLILLFFISMALYTRFSLRVSAPLSASWIGNLVLLGTSVGLTTATKLGGSSIWIWSIVVLVFDYFVIQINDIHLNTFKLIKIAVIEFSTVTVIPIIVFILPFFNMITTQWVNDNPSQSNFMSNDIKTLIRSNGSMIQPEAIYYGAIIQLRHKDSLGGYLASMDNVSYPTDLEEQFVGLVNDDSDPLTRWVVEHENPKFNKHLSTNTFTPVRDFSNIKLRHVVSGKLLRSSLAKPPISEEDYTKQVSCTRNSSYDGEGDETWTIITDDQIVNSEIVPGKSIVSFNNLGQDCSLISHDIKIDTDWAKKWQETLCLSSPNEVRTKFYITVVGDNLFNTDRQIPTVTKVLKFNKLKIMVEWLLKSFKYNWYIKNQDKDTNSLNIIQMIFYVSPDSTFTTVIWITSFLSIFVWGFQLFMKICRLFAHHFKQEDSNSDLEKKYYNSNFNLKNIMFDQVSFELVVAWFINYYLLSKIPHENIYINQYLPCFIFNLLLSIIIMFFKLI
ncbi:hypothetical protein TBLA_0A02990 [Henningerozyma blattae CBS 6284]|uniref:MIR domain-containing protein n=1 Tax=Henningerozyma blattae (strain ATCC 34711 / CBS 6284 / DSM 70876 / NBRC 10599 / NRRL Y-10934 / UCD 77-7) TaxID=1071380 RepID=I2GVE7_HENB6|nr:hypothetical protein TBLA_0A02990 [Tetrapisispora blattae CBS 6284]CCH58099.1 hypothetical protein TBLA_0A02990 [Tetrapisispora blattae CBS 6284]